MKFAAIMENAGVSTKIFPICGEINVTLYDEDDIIHESDDLRFIKPLFEDNPDSYEKFFDFVSELDTNPDYLSMNVQITQDYVIIFYKSPNSKIFRRTEPTGSFD